MKFFAATALAAALAATAALADDAPTPLPKNDYSDGANWLCLPGRADDACGRAKEDATVVTADGIMIQQSFKPDPDAPIDCFYVYPTVSFDKTILSDMTPGPEEYGVIQQQFARFGAKCKTYAPLYRQFTLTALVARQAGKPMQGNVDSKQNVNDVIDAWNYYLKNYNHGRGVVLIGHSQGSGVLIQMIKSEIDGKPVQKQILSALLMGTRLAVPKDGSAIGGDFKHIPLCKSPTQLQCAIAYASFRDTAPPPANTLFGKVQDPKMMAACSNPTALGGGEGPAQTYFGTGSAIVSASNKVQWVKDKPVTTTFVSTPGLVTAECKATDAGVTYLAVKLHPDPADPRTDDISGDVITGGTVQQQWGLHLIDANLFMGNLLEIVAQETEVYQKKHPAQHS
jgi:hypothetical protein